MSEGKGEKPYDPFETWRAMRDAGMENWAKVMTDTVRTDGYAQTSGAVLDAYLTASAPFHDLLQKVLAQTLQELNLPSRSEFTVLSERLTNIERLLDDIDTKLDQALARKVPPRSDPPKHGHKGGK
jgi:Poly(R)-hydroxyalkanoic acid synthase subunit (PHA_synth_III_E)